jgi:hypothetical protein
VDVGEESVQCAISDFLSLGCEDEQVGAESVDLADETSVASLLPTAGAAVKMDAGDTVVAAGLQSKAYSTSAAAFD